MSQLFGYKYDKNTMEFLGKIELFIDPIDNLPLLPKFATLAEPIETKDGEIAVYNQSRRKWEAIKDYRGVWFDLTNGNQAEILTIYDVSNAMPNNYYEVLSQRIPYHFEFRVLTLANGAKLTKENPHHHSSGLPFEFLEWEWQEKTYTLKKDVTIFVDKLKEILKKEYEEAIIADIEFNKQMFQTDDKSMNMLQNKALFMFDNEIVHWVVKNNSIVEMRKQDIIDLIRIINARNAKCFEIYQALKAKIRECSTHDELEIVLPSYIKILANSEDKENILFKN